jgi:hypothetical protein
MSSQIFKQPIPKDFLYQLLEKICLKTSKYYVVDMNAFRKMLFNKLHEQFCSDILSYYHLGKQFYVSREMTYNSFTTIIRQICKYHAIMFTSQIKYNESKYNINYHIYYAE